MMVSSTCLPRKRSRRRFLRRTLTPILALSLFYLATAWAGGCARPVRGLWPPAKGEPSYRLLVSVDSWHSVIGLWPEAQRGAEDPAAIEEWSYACKHFYLEGDTGCWGTFRALFTPTDGVVQVSRLGKPWSVRTPQPPARSWTFRLGEEGYRRLRAHLEAEKRAAEPIARTQSTWYLSRRDYHLFHHCHHWAARALRASGLPVWSFYALFKWSIEAQLDRAGSFDLDA